MLAGINSSMTYEEIRMEPELLKANVRQWPKVKAVISRSSFFPSAFVKGATKAIKNN
jgi:hypothetical protein